MPDREKVITALQLELEYPYSWECADKCQYYGKTDCDCFTQVAMDALVLLKGNESEWLEDSDPGQEYGTTWACRKCMHSIHERNVWNPYDSGYKYCPHCGAEMKVKWDD